MNMVRVSKLSKTSRLHQSDKQNLQGPWVVFKSTLNSFDCAKSVSEMQELLIHTCAAKYEYNE